MAGRGVGRFFVADVAVDAGIRQILQLMFWCAEIDFSGFGERAESD